MPIERSFELQEADLWDAVLNLSLPPEDQLSILEAAGDRQAIDELALEFDDAFSVVSEALQQDNLGRLEWAALNELNSVLNEMSGPANAEKWTPAALISDSQWEAVRRIARNALARRQVSKVQRASA